MIRPRSFRTQTTPRTDGEELEAVILAAGVGSRMGALTGASHKCLLHLAPGMPIIRFMLDGLAAAGISKVHVVLGHSADAVRYWLGSSCNVIMNERYAETNSLYSLCLTRPHINGSFLLLNADVVAEPAIYRRLRQTPGSVLAYDSSSGSDPEEMKVRLRDGRLADISKSMHSRDAAGESLGVVKFDGLVRDELFACAEEVLAQGGENAWAPAGYGLLAQSHPIHCLDVNGMAWTEIDFPEDLAFAQTTLWPGFSRSAAARKKRSA